VALALYRHLEALDRGDEEARERREAIGPFGLARSTLARHRARANRVTEKGLALGTARRGGVCRVPIGSEHGVHALVAGATGSGKTVTQAAVAGAHVEAGFAAMVVDPKGDRWLYQTMRDAAAGAGVPFHVWSPGGATIYNPLARGGPTEIADKALAAHEWSEPHYEMATRRLLGQVLQTLQAAGKWQTHRPSSTNRRARSSSRSTPPPRASRRRSAQPLIELLKGCRAPSELAGALAASRSDLSRVKFLAKADSLHNAVLQRFHMPYFCSLRERMSSEPV
jgi:hypothetical protein